MLQKNEPVIIKRRKRGKRNHGHGGAWKVAFADFTLAMMALFMVLWIMQIADQKERTMIVQYLRGDMNPSGPINPFDFETNASLAPPIIPSQPTFRGGESEGQEEGTLIPGQFDTQAQLTALARELDRVVQSSSMADNIAVTIVPQGIRILIHDNVNQFMFTRGSAKMQPYFEDLLLSLGPILKRITNSMVITGHTDSTPYAGDLFTNWELSSERALLARRMLERGGVKRNQVIQVTGMADQIPYITNDTAAAANRRIEALILTSSAEQLLRGMIGSSEHAVPKGITINEVKQQATTNSLN